MIKVFKEDKSMEVVFKAMYVGSEVVFNKELNRKIRRVGLMQDGSEVLTFVFDRDSEFNIPEDVDRPTPVTVTARVTRSGKYFNIILYKLELDK